MKKQKQISFPLCAATLIVFLLGCGDLEQYEKPAAETDAGSPPATQEIDLKTSADVRERARNFKIRLEHLRITFRGGKDTIATINGLDRLLIEADIEQKTLVDDAQFRIFYLLASADILNQAAQLREAVGDAQGARLAREKLIEIRGHLPQ